MSLNTIESIKQYNPSFWTDSPIRSLVLEALVSRAPEGGRITDRNLKPIYTLADKNKWFSSKHQRDACIRNVLTHTNEMGFTKADIPTRSLPAPRPSVLPRSGEDFTLLTTIENMRTFLWEQWLRQPNLSKNALLFAYTVSMLTDGAIADPGLSWIINTLCYEHISIDGRLVIPFDTDSASQNKAHIYQPITSELLANSLLDRFARNNRKERVFLPEVPDGKKRKKAIKNLLESQYKTFCLDFLKHNPEVQLPRLVQFKRVSRLLPILKYDLEPFFTTVSSHFPLPTAHPSNQRQPIIRDDFSITAPKLVLKEIVQDRNTRLQRMRNDDNLDDDEYSRTNIRNSKYQHWCAEAQAMIGRLNHLLSKISKTRLTSANQIEKAHNIINGLLAEADQMAPKTSALHLALLWTRSLIKRKKPYSNPKVRSISEYLSRVFRARLLTYPDSYDLSLWSPEDHETLAERFIEDDSISSKTRSEVAITLQRVYRFANQNGFCQNVDIKWITNEVYQGRKRARLIDPSDFAEYLDSFDPSDRKALIMKVASILGYYAGMRANEMTVLTLDNIILYDDECFIEIHGGKTPAARRRIPLHLLAPKAIYQWIEIWWQQRRAEFNETARLDKIHLFGPTKKRQRFTRSNLTNVVIGHLKLHFGKDIVFHSLRHNFASWLFLRWYALRYPIILDDLYDRNNPIFSHAAQRKLALLFSSETGELSDPARPNDLVVLSKLQGHLGQKTLFDCYVHTFHIAHKHAMERVSKHLNCNIPGEVIANLARNMKHGSTQAKIKEKTVKGILEFLVEKNYMPTFQP